MTGSSQAKTPAESSGIWLIEQVVEEAKRSGDPLAPEEMETLKMPLSQVMRKYPDGSSVVPLNNKVVALARRAMERSKAAGNPTVKPRRGLRIPEDWFRHYTTIYETELPWFISGALQNAMLANPFAGEQKPWKSK